MITRRKKKMEEQSKEKETTEEMGSGDKQGNDNISKMITELREQIKEEASENKKIFREVKDQMEELRKQMEEIKIEVGQNKKQAEDQIKNVAYQVKQNEEENKRKWENYEGSMREVKNENSQQIHAQEKDPETTGDKSIKTDEENYNETVVCRGNGRTDQAGGINQFLKIKVFNGHVGESPMEHIHSLERYFHFNKISEEGKTAIACSHLQGASQAWWDSLYQRPETFEKYKQALVKGYWSEDLQETIRQQVEQEKWRPGEGFAPFVQRQTARLRSLVATSLSEHQIVRIVRHNLPQNIEQMLIGAGTKTVEQLMETVLAFDNSRSTQDYRDKGFRQQPREPAVNTIRYGQQSKTRKENTRTKTNNKVGLEIVNLVYDGNDAEIEAIRQPCPKIKVLVEGIGAEALIDSGSQVSVISKELFEQISCTDPRLKTLPLKTSYVTLANGKRAQLASKQVWVEIQIRQRSYHQVLLILENLIQEVILGADFLHQTGCCINFKTKEVILGEDKIGFDPQGTDQAIATCCVKGVQEEPEPVIKIDDITLVENEGSTSVINKCSTGLDEISEANVVEKQKFYPETAMDIEIVTESLEKSKTDVEVMPESSLDQQKIVENNDKFRDTQVNEDKTEYLNNINEDALVISKNERNELKTMSADSDQSSADESRRDQAEINVICKEDPVERRANKPPDKI